MVECSFPLEFVRFDTRNRTRWQTRANIIPIRSKITRVVVVSHDSRNKSDVGSTCFPFLARFERVLERGQPEILLFYSISCLPFSPLCLSMKIGGGRSSLTRMYMCMRVCGHPVCYQESRMARETAVGRTISGDEWLIRLVVFSKNCE